MQRVLVLGPPGSGKSTLARRLGQQHGLPVIHLDQLFWHPGWVEAPAPAFAAAIAQAAAAPAWIIEGNYTTAAIAPRLAAADTILFLDTPNWLSIWRILRRTIRHHGHVRPDAAPGCPERLDPAFLRYTWSWNRTRRAPTLALLGTAPAGVTMLRGGRAGEGPPAPEASQAPWLIDRTGATRRSTPSAWRE